MFALSMFCKNSADKIMLFIAVTNHRASLTIVLILAVRKITHWKKREPV